MGIAEIYVQLILKGKRCFLEVPCEVREKVRELLIEIDREDLLE